MPPATEPPFPVLRPKHGNLARWLAIGVLGAGLSASSALSAWRDEHAILINTTQSLPNWAFFIDKARKPARGDFVVFTPPVVVSMVLKRFMRRRSADRPLGNESGMAASSPMTCR